MVIIAPHRSLTGRSQRRCEQSRTPSNSTGCVDSVSIHPMILVPAVVIDIPTADAREDGYCLLVGFHHYKLSFPSSRVRLCAALVSLSRRKRGSPHLPGLPQTSPIGPATTNRRAMAIDGESGIKSA